MSAHTRAWLRPHSLAAPCSPDKEGAKVDANELTARVQLVGLAELVHELQELDPGALLQIIGDRSSPPRSSGLVRSHVVSLPIRAIDERVSG